MVAEAGDRNEIFGRIVDLNVGESLVFSPSSFVRLDGGQKPKKLGSGILRMKTRLREGVDGGRSVMAAGPGAGEVKEDEE